MPERHGEAKVVHFCQLKTRMSVLQIVLGSLIMSPYLAQARDGSIMATLTMGNRGSILYPTWSPGSFSNNISKKMFPE